MQNLILSALEGYAKKPLHELPVEEIDHQLKVVIEMSVWFGDLLKRQLKEAGYSSQVIDAIMADTKYHKAYYESFGIKFNADGSVI